MKAGTENNVFAFQIITKLREFARNVTPIQPIMVDSVFVIMGSLIRRVDAKDVITLVDNVKDPELMNV